MGSFITLIGIVYFLYGTILMSEFMEIKIHDNGKEIYFENPYNIDNYNHWFYNEYLCHPNSEIEVQEDRKKKPPQNSYVYDITNHHHWFFG